MKDLFLMWRYPRMIAYVITTATLYVVLMIPLKGILITPQVDVGRIGIVVPIVFSFLFGPAAAWGAALGNVVGDYIGAQLNVGSIFGFIANFLIGYIPYRAWDAMTEEEPDMRSFKKVLIFVYIAILVNVIAGVVIGWGLNWLGWVPFSVIAGIIALTNSVWATTLGPILQGPLYRVAKGAFPLYHEITHKKWTCYLF